MSNKVAIVFKSVEYTRDGLFDLRGSDLVALHNELAVKAGVAPTKRFASMGKGVDRVWALLTAHGKVAVAAPAAKEAPAAPAQRVTDQPKVKRSTNQTKPLFDKKITAAKAPEGRRGIIHAMYDISKAAGTTNREDLVTKIIAGLTPPRSKHYDRNYVLGYLAWGVRSGFFRIEDAA
jgi:hypothetical protein